MGTTRKRGDSWRAEVYRRGVRDSGTFRTRQQALDWIEKREAEIDSGAPPRSFGAAVDKITADPTRSKFDKLRLAAFRSRWGQVQLSNITSAMIAEWRDERLKQVSPGTVLREITVLRNLFAVARQDWQWTTANPVADVRKPRAPQPRKVTITDDERDEMLGRLKYTGTVETLAHETAVALLIALETGMRAGEIMALRPQDIKGNVAVVVKSKTGPGRDVPLSKRAVELFEVMSRKRLRRRVNDLDGRVFHLTSGSLDVTFRRARDADPPMRRFHFHDARATAITRLVHTLNPLELARMVGHSDLSSLMIYYRPSASSLAERLG
jgi:integrase